MTRCRCAALLRAIFHAFDFEFAESGVSSNPVRIIAFVVNGQIGSNRLLVVKDIKPIKLDFKEKHPNILSDVGDNITSAPSRNYNICDLDDKLICVDGAARKNIWDVTLVAFSIVGKIGVVRPSTSSNFTGYFATPRWGLPTISHPHSKPDIIPANRIPSIPNTEIRPSLSLAYLTGFSKGLVQKVSTHGSHASR